MYLAFFSGVPASSTYSCGHEVCTGCWAVVDWPRAEHKASKLENDVVHASGGRSSSTTGPRNNAWSGTTLKRKAQRQTWGLKMNGHYAWKNSTANTEMLLEANILRDFSKLSNYIQSWKKISNLKSLSIIWKIKGNFEHFEGLLYWIICF